MCSTPNLGEFLFISTLSSFVQRAMYQIQHKNSIKIQILNTHRLWFMQNSVVKTKVSYTYKMVYVWFLLNCTDKMYPILIEGTKLFTPPG